jgi:short-subunit dehydrogenase
MKNWALITGATVGIGKAFSELLASEGYNLILVSRDIERLENVGSHLESSFGIEVITSAHDLSIESNVDQLRTFFESEGRFVEILVNNAGFGLNRDFHHSEIEEQKAWIDVMVTAPMKLTYFAIPGMLRNKCGYIINVASVAAFMHGSTYCSAKSWLLNFSETISSELKPFGINVHASCPGFTKTEFHSRCSQDVSGVPEFLWLTPELIAKKAWEGVQGGKRISIPRIEYKILVGLHSYAPKSLVRLYSKLAKLFLRRGGRNPAQGIVK